MLVQQLPSAVAEVFFWSCIEGDAFQGDFGGRGGENLQLVAECMHRQEERLQVVVAIGAAAYHLQP